MSATAQLGPGSVVLASAVVNANASLHQGVLVNSGAVIDHDAICGAYSQLGVHAAMAGVSRLGSPAWPQVKFSTAAKPISPHWYWHLVSLIPEKA